MFLTIMQILVLGVVGWWVLGRSKVQGSRDSSPLIPLALIIFLGTIQSWTLTPLLGDVGTQDQVRIGGAVIGGVMLLWAGHAVIGRLLTTGRIVVPRLYPYELIILLFFPLSILSTLVGLAMGNSADYIATDMYKFVFISVVYFAVVVAVRRETATDLYKALLQLALILTVFSVINQISIIGIEGEIRRVTPIFGAYFVLPYFLMVEISKGRDPVFKTSRAVRALIFLMLFLNIFLSFSRISWFVSAAEIILGLVLARIHRRTLMDGVRTAEGGG